MEAYLDNSATTKCAREVVETVDKSNADDYGNPSSKHMKGVDAEQYIKQGRGHDCQKPEMSGNRIGFYVRRNGIQQYGNYRNSYGKQAPRESRYRIKRGTFFRQRAV